jgi:hypothetical protein
LKPNNGRKGLGYNSHKVNPSIEHKGWRSPKFIEGTCSIPKIQILKFLKLALNSK